MKRLLVCMFVVAACGTQRIDICHMDSDCTNPAFGFCDVNGEYPAADGEKNVCTITPSNCPPERCGCTPGGTTCSNNELAVCDPGGMSAAKTACDLGCATDGTHCLAFVPSNSLADALAMASGEPDVEIPNFDTISSDGSIKSDIGVSTPVTSILLAQSSGTGLRVFIARSFTIHNAQLSGQDNAIAFVSTQPIVIDGLVDASSYRAFGGPGAQLTSSACNGIGGTYGGGGGGNATAGGNGSPIPQLPPAAGAPGGAARVDTFEPIGGGCPGGDEGGTSFGGHGGGALQFVSNTSLTVASTGIINVGGGGGGDGGGGGAGGTVLIETPTVSINGKITANGGSGGTCGMDGLDATPDATPAPRVGGCGTGNIEMSGAGGTGLSPPTDGEKAAFSGGAGGGGSAGRLAIHTRDGTYAHPASAVLSAKISTSSLQLK